VCVRERFLFLLMKLALAPKRALPLICPAFTAWLDLDMLPPLEAAGTLNVEQPPFAGTSYFVLENSDIYQYCHKTRMERKTHCFLLGNT